MVCRSAVWPLRERSFALGRRDRDARAVGRGRMRRPATPATLRRRASGRADGIFPRPTRWFACPNRCCSPRAATSNIPMRSCPRNSPKTNGCKCRRSGRCAVKMCITRWSTFGRRTRSGCGTRRSACLLQPRVSRDEQDRRDAGFTNSDVLLVYAPGSSPDQWPEGMAKFVPRGSDLVFQMHYMRAAVSRRSNQHRTGFCQASAAAAGPDLTTNQQPLRHSARRGRLSRGGARDPAERCTAAQLFSAHAPARKDASSTTSSIPADGAETLLRVNYDFYWQLSYRLA